MNDLTIFNYTGRQVRTVIIADELRFVAKDVCEILDIANAAQAIAKLDEDAKGICLTDTLGGKQRLTTVSEPGLYSLIGSSRKPEAKAFKRWVNHEVLPSIRKTGSYSVASQPQFKAPQTMSEVLRFTVDAWDKAHQLEVKMEEDAPYTDFGKEIADHDGCISLSDMASILNWSRNTFAPIFGYCQPHSNP